MHAIILLYFIRQATSACRCLKSPRIRRISEGESMRLMRQQQDAYFCHIASSKPKLICVYRYRYAK